MLRLRTHKGRFYIRELEVKAEPVYLGLEGEIGWDPRAGIPDLSNVIETLVNDTWMNGINLYNANSVRVFILGEKNMPEQEVKDGKVPAEIKRKVLFDFYNAMPVRTIGKENVSS